MSNSIGNSNGIPRTGREVASGLRNSSSWPSRSHWRSVGASQRMLAASGYTCHTGASPNNSMHNSSQVCSANERHAELNLPARAATWTEKGKGGI